MNAVLQILGIVTLSIPYVWEVLNDKDGDAHISRVVWNDKAQISSKRLDIYARCFFMVIAAVANIFITGHNFFISLFMAGAIHFLLFDYTVIYVLIKRKVLAATTKWWDRIGSKGFDNYQWWKNKSWQIRMAIKVAVFIIACIIYFRW